MLISLAELAMLKNVSRAAVTKKIKSGKLEGAVVNHNGRKMVNKEEAFRLWDMVDTRTVTTVKKELRIPNKKAKTPKPDIIFREDITDFLFVLIDLTVNMELHQMNLLNCPL